jgi:hypothetical protein
VQGIWTTTTHNLVNAHICAAIYSLPDSMSW